MRPELEDTTVVGVQLKTGEVAALDLEFHDTHRRTTLFELFARGCALYNEAMKCSSPLLVPGYFGESAELLVKALLVVTRTSYRNTHRFGNLVGRLDPKLLDALLRAIGHDVWGRAVSMLDRFINAPQRRYGSSGSQSQPYHVSLYSDTAEIWRQAIGDMLAILRDLIGTAIWRNFPCRSTNVQVKAYPIYVGSDVKSDYWSEKGRSVFGISLSLRDLGNNELSKLWSLIPMDRHDDRALTVVTPSDAGDVEVTVQLEYERGFIRTLLSH